MSGLFRSSGPRLSRDGRDFILKEAKARGPQLLGFVLLSLVAALIEMTGVGLVFPLLIVLVDPAKLEKVPFLAKLIDSIGIGWGTELSILIICLIGVLMVSKNAYMIFFNWLQMYTLARWKTDLSKRLMYVYLFSDYSVHLAKTSSEIIRNMSLTAAIFDQFVTAMINLAVNTVMLLALCSLLVFVLPLESMLSVAFIGVVVWSLYAKMRKPFEEIGKELNLLFKLRQSILRQAIGMIMETKLSAKEYFFLDAYVEIEQRNFSRQARYNFMAIIPPLATEGAVIIGILSIVSYLLFVSGDQNTGLAILGLLAATLFRLTPVLNRILSSLQLMNLSRNSVEIVAREFNELNHLVFRSDVEPESMPFSKKISFEGVSYAYPSANVRAVENLTFDISKGELIGITGTSGAGKSTLAALLLGLIQPAVGQVLVDDTPLTGPALLRAWYKHIGFVPQDVFLIEDTIACNIAFGTDTKDIDEDRIWEALNIVQLSDFVAGLPNGLNEFVGEDGSRLSGGQRQRLGIARVLYENPEILLFDEATSSLDTANERAFSESLMRVRKSRTLIMIAHRLSTLRDCDRIIMMDKGTILDIDTFDNLQARCPAFANLVQLAKLERVP